MSKARRRLSISTRWTAGATPTTWPTKTTRGKSRSFSPWAWTTATTSRTSWPCPAPGRAGRWKSSIGRTSTTPSRRSRNGWDFIRAWAASPPPTWWARGPSISNPAATAPTAPPSGRSGIRTARRRIRSRSRWPACRSPNWFRPALARPGPAGLTRSPFRPDAPGRMASGMAMMSRSPSPTCRSPWNT